MNLPGYRSKMATERIGEDLNGKGEVAFQVKRRSKERTRRDALLRTNE